MNKFKKAKLLSFAKNSLIILVSLYSTCVLIANLTNLKQSDNKYIANISKIFPNVTLGLDLKGGSQIMLSVELDRIMNDRYSAMTPELKDMLWSGRIPYSSIKNTAEGIILSTSELSPLNISDIEKVILKPFPELSIKKCKDGAILYINDKEQASIRSSVMEKILKTVRNRIDEFGTKEVVIQRFGSNNVIIQVPGIEDPEQLKRLLGKVASLTFHLLDEEEPTTRTSFSFISSDFVAIPDYKDKDLLYKVRRYVSLNGSELVDARVTMENMKVGIAFRMNSSGARKFADITDLNVGKGLAIVLDNKVLTAPIINTPILSGSGIINGAFTVEEAKEIAGLLRSGSLPAPVKIVEERTVGPSVGLRSVKSAVLAGIIAITGITVFMIIKYRLLGLIASFAVIINLTLAVTMIAIFGISLTLPGIAALLLTLSMSVDANVLIYERIRDEIRSGKSTTEKIISNGFKGSWTGILDSNVTTFLAAITMIAFGSGFIKGFAVSLIVGITCSLFSSILLSKALIDYMFISKKYTVNLK